MGYWCYTVNFDDNAFDEIMDKRMITIPAKYDFSMNDRIILYIRENKKDRIGFRGYIITTGKMKKSCIEIFDAEYLNEYMMKVKYIHFKKKPIKKEDVITDKKLLKEFLKINFFQDVLNKLSDKLGKFICSKFKDEPDTIRTKYIVPIMIIPCEDFYKKVYKFEDESDQIQWLFDHMSFCSSCDVTNNNKRASVDMVYDKIIATRVYSDEDKINELIHEYHTVNCHINLKLKDNQFEIIKIDKIGYMYDNCYCIVGKTNVFIEIRK